KNTHELNFHVEILFLFLHPKACSSLQFSAICQKTNDNAVGQAAGPQWTRCHRGPTAFPSPIARCRNLPRVAASPQLPACLRLQPSGAVRPRNQSVPCSTAIGNLPSPIQKTRAWALRLGLLYPEFPSLGLSPAWVLRAALAECPPCQHL